MNQIATTAEKMGLLHEFQYMNYADSSQHPLQSYGRENFEFLGKASKKYDPKGMFQWQVPGGFKLYT